MDHAQPHECTSLLGLPNEILLRILIPFPTQSLLPLTAVCYRFHDLVLRILHGRLLAAASLKQHKLILECYHPASKNAEPYLFCDYLGTPGLSDTTEGQGLVYEDEENIGRLGKLGGLYSRFRPIRLEEEERIFLRHPAGEVPGARSLSVVLPTVPLEETENRALVTHNINLDIDEWFSQLCVVTNLVKLGPRRGVFLNFVGVSDGLVRVKRDWLASAVQKDAENDPEARTLWLDNGKTVGLRVRVKENGWRRTARPVLIHRDEDPAVSYTLQYEELLIRTTQLLLAVEEAILQGHNETSKAIVFGSFISQN